MQDAARVFAQGGRLLALAGEHYGTDILCRGNLIRVKGSEEKVYKSLSVIEEILSDAKRGIRVSERQMLLIMKLFDEGKMELLHEMKEDIINLTRNGEAVCRCDPSEFHYLWRWSRGNRKNILGGRIGSFLSEKS